MPRYVCFILFICTFCLELNAQNPFDLKSRLKGGAAVPDTAAVNVAPSEVTSAEEIDVEDSVSELEVATVEKEDPAPLLDPAKPILEPIAEEPKSEEPKPEEAPISIPEGKVTAPLTPLAPQQTSTPPGFFKSVKAWNANLSRNLASATGQGNSAGNQNLLFGISLFILLLLAVLMVLNRRMLRDAYRAMSNDNYLRFLFRDYQNKLWIYRTFYLYFFINAGFFIYLTVSISAGADRPSIAVLPMAIGLIMLVYSLRHVVLQIIGSSFPVSKETELFGFIIMLINIVFGLVLTPINLGLAFGPPFLLKTLIFIGLGLFIFLYIFRQLKGLFLSSRLLGTYLFHFFLYFCIVEIAPLLVIGKLASTHLGVH